MFRWINKNQEEKTHSQSYIQKLLSYPKKVLTTTAQSLTHSNITGLMHLMLSLNLFEFLPKAKADEIYVLLKEIYFALKFDKSGPLKGLTTELINACSNITIFSTSNLTYTEFYNTGCTGEGDKRLSMLIEADKNTTNNTQLLMNCTLDIIQKINDSCDFDNLAYGALIAFASLAGFVCVLWCGYSIYSALKPKTDELQQDPSIELTQPHSPIKTEPTINHPQEKNIPPPLRIHS